MKEKDSIKYSTVKIKQSTVDPYYITNVNENESITYQAELSSVSLNKEF